MRVDYHHYESTREFADQVKNYDWSKSRGWNDKSKSLQGVEELYSGCNKYNSLIEQITSKVFAKVPHPQKVWDHHVQGFFPDVPTFLSGDPESMWTQYDEESLHSPIKIFVCITSSAMIPESTLAKRGAALAALMLALSNMRTVTIIPYIVNSAWNGGGTLISWEIKANPLSLSELGACLASENVSRYVGLNAGYYLHPDNADGGHVHLNGNPEEAKKYLGWKEGDLYFPAIHGRDPLVTDPISEVNRYIDYYMNPDTEISQEWLVKGRF